ncbi:MAG TPA: translocation/assembly module TamB domain-containing protein, partial [Thermoanaerobaculia bacterium]|nr:translocation/assembly module TamB domain-containing protein [Thermoanaerobaculia bacterium]
WLLGCAGSALGLLLLLGLTVFFLLGTQTGTRFLFTRLGTLMPGSFEVQTVQGSITSPLEIRNLTYKREGAIEIHVAHLLLQWRLAELLDRRLDVEKLYADGIRIVKAPAKSTEKTPLPDINLRFNILVRDAQVRGLDVASEDGKSLLTIDRIDLKTSELKNVFHLDRLSVRSAVVNADVAGRLTPQGDYPLNLDARWSVRPPGMAQVVGGGKLTGSLKRLEVEQKVTAPFPVEVKTLLLEPLYDLRFDGKVTFKDVNPRQLKADLPDLPASGEVAGRGSLAAFTSDGTVRGRFAPAGDFAVRYRLAREGKDGETWRIEKADVTLPGTSTHLSASGSFTQPAAPPGQSAPLTAQADLTWQSLAWPPRGKASFASPEGHAKVEAHGTTTALTSTGTVDGTLAAPLGRLVAVYQVVRQGEIWRIEKADVTLPGTPAAVHLSGTVKAPQAGPLGFDAKASWRDVAWPLRGTPVVRSAAGSAAVSGSPERYHAQVAADLAGPTGGQIPPGHWTLTGEGTQSEFHFAALQGDLLHGRLNGRGTVGWVPRPRWDLTLDGQGLDPTGVRPDLPGKLDFIASTRGELRPEGPQGKVDLPRLSGTLRAQPLSANAAVKLAGKEYEISHLSARWGDARASASGRVGDRLDLTWEADLPNLALALPGAGGALGGHGHLSGPVKTPRVNADLHFAGLTYGDNHAAQGTLKADVDLAPAGTTQLDLATRQIAAGGQQIGELTLTLRGTLNQHTLSAAVTGLGTYPKARLDLALAGAAHGQLGPQLAWQGQINRLSLRGGPAGDWDLAKSADLAASAQSARLDGLCWKSGGAELCAQGSWAKAGSWSGQANLTALPLNLLKPLLPPDLTITGAIEGTARASGSASGLREAVADLSPGPGELRFPGDSGRTVAVRFERGTLHARLEPTGGDANAALTLTNIGKLGLTARLPGLGGKAALKDLPLAGRFETELRDVSFVQGFVPELRGLSGSLNAAFDLAGTLGTPRLKGQAKLAGRTRVAEYGLDLKDLQLTATGDGGPLLKLHASVRSGSGTMTADGTTGIFPSAATPLKLKVSGRRFQVMNTREIILEASPDLDVAYQGTQAKVTGQVVVPYGRTNIEDRKKPGAVPASKDVVFVGAKAPAPPKKAPLALSAQVRLILGDQIELKALGLDARP